MPLVIPDGFGQVLHTITLANDPEPMAVTYGVQLNAPESAPIGSEMNNLHDNFHTAIAGLLLDTYTLTRTTVKWRQPGAAELAEVLWNENKVGVVATSPLPQNCAYLIHKHTGFVGRRYRGRMYLPGPAENEVSPTGVFTSTRPTTATVTLNTYLASFNQTGMTKWAGMYLLHGTGESTTPAPTPITQLLVDPIIATQRKRLRR